MSSIITQEFLTDFESNMSRLTENEYLRLSEDLWWSRVMKTRPSRSKREQIAWFIQTASIEPLGKTGGKMIYDKLAEKMVEYEHENFGKGLQLSVDQFEDLDGNGIDAATEWSTQMGALMAYWPQQKAAELLMAGHESDSVSYDGVPFFSASHPSNPTISGGPTYANVFTGSAAGVYPGACPIDDSIPIDTARANLSKMFAYIRGLKMPNGILPRKLKPSLLVVPPRMQERAVQLTSAKFIAQAASGGGAGSGDFEAVIAAMNFQVPVIADELAGWESETSFFIVCEQIGASQLGALLYLERKPFAINYYNNVQNIDLGRTNQLEWLLRGRNSSQYGHPYLAFKGKGA